jgi:hypothetical protein
MCMALWKELSNGNASWRPERRRKDIRLEVLIAVAGI